MNISFTKNAEAMDIYLDGRLDTNTACEFDSFIAANCNGISALTVNCEKLAYVSSAGLRVLLSAQKKMQGAMKLTHVCEIVMDVFEMTGFADILVIE